MPVRKDGMVLTAGAPCLRARTSEVFVVHLRLSLRILQLSRHLNAATCSGVSAVWPGRHEVSVLLLNTRVFDHAAPLRLPHICAFVCRNMLADILADASSLRMGAG